MVRQFWFLLFFPVAGAVNVAMAIFGPAMFDQILIGGLMALAFGILVFVIGPYLQVRSALKNPNFHGELTFRFSGEGIEESGQHASGRMDWSLVKGVSETRRYIFVHMKQGGFELIPKDKLTSQEVTVLKSVLRAHAPGKVSLREQ
jgi:YcxB-like protein